MRQLSVVFLACGLATISACNTPTTPADTGPLPDVGGDGSRADGAVDSGRDANVHDVGTSDVGLTDGGLDGGGLDANDLDANDLDGNVADGGLDGNVMSDGGCVSAATCDDGDGCTTDACVSGACTHAPRSIDDSDACTTDACDSSTGTITHVAVSGIDDSNACTTDACNSTTGTITHAPISGIDDSNVCTTDTCSMSSGTITHAPVAGCCNASSECSGGICQSHACVPASCSDGMHDGGETDQDCGGPVCGACAIGLHCAMNTDCTTNACSGSVCVECNAPSDCGTDTVCQTHTCNAHVCGVSNVATGIAAGTQTSGDCRQNQCDGSGHPLNAIDNADLPSDDGNQCTSEVCSGGSPTHPSVVAGAACSQGGGSFCDGAGACVQCTAAAQCAGSDTECHTRTCVSGTCGAANVPNGTLTSAQTPGDCHQNQCDGAGNIVSVAANADIPTDDGNQCTSETCTSGVPSHPNVGTGTACNQGGGIECNGAGACVQCLGAGDCGANTACQSHTCISGLCGVNNVASGTVVSDPAAGDCHDQECDGNGNQFNAVANGDVPVDGNQCTSDVCTAGVASNPPLASGTACSQSGGTACDGAGACVPPTPPTVTSTSPADGVTAATMNPSIAITFSTAMNPATLTAQTALGACSGSIQVSLDNFATCVAFASAAPVMSGSNTVATLIATPGLLVNRIYKIRVTTTATNASGTALATTYTQATGFMTGGVTGCGGTGVVIAQVYGGGGNAGSVWKNDFIVLHNRGTAAVSLAGWSVQYAGATGTSWTPTALTGTIQPGAYYLVQEAVGAGGTTSLPTPDATGAIPMSATGGKVALVSSTTALTGACPTGAQIVDMLGFGAANCSETAPSAAPTNTTAAVRAQAGCTDSNNNATDFAVGTPTPLNTSSATMSCGCTQNESGASGEVDYCNTQFPLSLTVQTGVTSPTTYGQIFEGGTTEAAGASASVLAQLGYGPVSVNPEYEYGWVWGSTTYNAQIGNNDEYQATFTAPATGSYRYGYRFSLDGGSSWTYCDNNQADSGAGSNVGLTFDLTNLGVLTVTP